MMRNKISFLFLLLCFCSETLFSREPLPADITFVIADFKYNERQGVQICEIQPGSASVFEAYDFLNNGRGLVPKMFYDLISRYQLPVWYFNREVYEKARHYFKIKGWSSIDNLHHLLADINFIIAANSPVINPGNLRDYHGIVYGRPASIISSVNLPAISPGVIFLDAALFPYFNDKYRMNSLLSSREISDRLKPQWNQYSCLYSPKLVQTILNDFSSPFLVIKPTNSSLGKGVIILDRNDLDKTLEYIFQPEDSRMDSELFNDPCYTYWRESGKENFIVEEFVESDPVYVDWFDNKPYDATARAIILLTYDQKNIDFKLLDAFWKLPIKSIADNGTLTEKHKSYGQPPYYFSIDPETSQKMEARLGEGLTEAYRAMLGI